MKRCEMKISKELYDKSLEHKNSIPRDMEMEVFGASICMGYGLYGTYTYEKDGEYYCSYSIGDSCD